MESVGYCVRVQALDGYGEFVGSLQFVTDYTSALAVKHKGKRGENPHFHIVIRTSVKQQAFRVRMKNLFKDGKGNEHMSIRPWDGDSKALSYLFHEDAGDHVTPIYLRKEVPDEFLSFLRAQNVAITAEVVKAKGKSSHTLFDDAVAHFGKSIKSPRDVARLQDEEIATYMMLHAMRAGKYAPQPWLLRSMVLKCKFHLLKGDVSAEEEYASQYVKSIFQR